MRNCLWVPEFNKVKVFDALIEELVGVNESSHFREVLLEELEAEALKTDFSFCLDLFYFLGGDFRELGRPFKGPHQVPEDRKTVLICDLDV